MSLHENPNKDILEALVGAMPEDNDANDWVVREDGSILVDGRGPRSRGALYISPLTHLKNLYGI